MAGSDSGGDKDHVLAASVGLAVEPAVAGLYLEACLLEERLPLLPRDPRERHRRLARWAAHRERERARIGVPLGSLVDAGLALQPATVRLGDVVWLRREDVEDKTPAREQRCPRGRQRVDPLPVVGQVEIRA